MNVTVRAAVAVPSPVRCARHGCGDDIVLVKRGITLIPTAAGDEIHAEWRTADPIELMPIVHSQRVQGDAAGGKLHRLEHERVGRKPTIHELADDRVRLINVVASPHYKVAAYAG